MPVSLGQEPQPGFDEPIRLLMDCHRRIERFLGMLLRVADECAGGPLPVSHREAAEAALRYFTNAAPWHTEDEEHSLFPAMRAVGDARVADALSRLAHLEHEHDRAEAAHAEVAMLMRRWLDDEALPAASLDRLRAHLTELRTIYQRHIAEEDDVIFPLAAEVLSAEAVAAIGKEMAHRRGLDVPDAGPRCKHARHNRDASASGASHDA